MESNIGNACFHFIKDAALRHEKNVHIVDLYVTPTWKTSKDPLSTLLVDIQFKDWVVIPGWSQRQHPQQLDHFLLCTTMYTDQYKGLQEEIFITGRSEMLGLLADVPAPSVQEFLLHQRNREGRSLPYPRAETETTASPDHTATASPDHPPAAASPDYAAVTASLVHAAVAVSPDHAAAVDSPDHAAAVASPDHAVAVASPDHAAAVDSPDHAAAVASPDHAAAVASPDHSLTVTASCDHAVIAVSPDHAADAASPDHTASVASPDHEVTVASPDHTVAATPDHAASSPHYAAASPQYAAYSPDYAAGSPVYAATSPDYASANYGATSANPAATLAIRESNDLVAKSKDFLSDCISDKKVQELDTSATCVSFDNPINENAKTIVEKSPFSKLFSVQRDQAQVDISSESSTGTMNDHYSPQVAD
ncbi:hypothetical protein WMY93_002413 [Mugilogobius chulae]|uniref:Uncharacterized protein n=1 Tax=Mugilogobius chulae TaxID=88201 RepID=A0AAW0Q4E7_9GOBI